MQSVNAKGNAMRTKLVVACATLAIAVAGCLPSGSSSTSSSSKSADAERVFRQAWNSLSDVEQFHECVSYISNESGWITKFKSSPSPTPSDTFIKNFMRGQCS